MFSTETKQTSATQTQDWQIKQGPRIKSLATRHLEYIAYAALLGECSEVKDNKVNIKGKTFDLSALLNARPDFEQITFSETQLDAYMKYRAKFLEFKTSSDHLHKAEQWAIYNWTSGQYSSFNYIRQSVFLNLDYLLKICIAAHGLTKPTPQIPSKRSIFRKEGYVKQVHSERDSCAKEKKPIIEKGFTAFSKYNYVESFKYHQVSVSIFQPKALNTIGKDIAKLSQISEENEILFPPNTEFKYTCTGFLSYTAEPIRSVTLEDAKYSHAFSATDLVEISLDKAKLQIRFLQDFLQNQLTLNKHSTFKSIFDTVDNDKKLLCLHMVLTKIKQILTKDKFEITDVNAILEASRQAVAENNRLVKQSFLPSAPGKIDKVLCSVIGELENIDEDLSLVCKNLLESKSEKSESVMLAVR